MRFVLAISDVDQSSTLWPVIGHRPAVRFLQQSALHRQPTGALLTTPHHAYLFLGPRQIGKSTLARAFAQAILCTDNHQRPCGVCRACRLLRKATHPDFRLVAPVDKSGSVDRIAGTLRADQASELVRDAALRPVEGCHKFFLLQDFHNANDAFANKLLKTLEEPPGHIILCLTALDRYSLLPTIVSRCQVIELRPLDPLTIADALRQQWQAPADQAELLARLARGRLGWAVDQLKHPTGRQERIEQLQTLWKLMAANRIERLAFSEQLAASCNSQQLFSLLEIWTTWWRDLLLAQSNSLELCSNIDQLAEIEQQGAQIRLANLQDYLHLQQRVESFLHHTVNTRLALDVLLLRLPTFRA
jgi:DNA polymerase-3 subunit delta'